MSNEKKVIEFTDDELRDAGFLGYGASETVQETIQAIKKIPDHFEWFTPVSPRLPKRPRPSPSGRSCLSDTPTIMSQSSSQSGTTAVPQHLVSPFEKIHFYHGISDNPPELFYRSDLKTNPFNIIHKDGYHSELPVKTAQGVFDTALNPIWRSTVAPAIIALLKARSIRRSVLKVARFSTPDEDGKDVLGPIVIWIALHPNTTTPEACRDVSPDILNILETNGVHGAVVHWYEGSVEQLGGPPLLRVADNTDPTFYVSRALTAVLGLPLAAAEMEDKDSQGSLSFYFHEGKTKKGEPSDRVLGVSNKHVLRKDTNVDYELGHTGAPHAFVRVCGYRRFQAMVNETRALIVERVGDAEVLAEQIAELEAEPTPKDEDEAANDADALKKKRQELEGVNRDKIKLEKFLKDLNSNWRDYSRRTIGWVDWAPRIRIDVDKRAYTLDIATFVLDPAKFKKEFKGNFVHLRGKYTSNEIKGMFYPNVANPPSFKYPANHLFRILGVVTAKRLANPDFYDEQMNPAFIVAKNGQSTDLTFGRYSGLETYLCDKFDHESIEVAIYNFDKRSGDFSAKGDSGSLIFNAEGKMFAILHSGMPRGLNSHVTFASPAHFIIEQLLTRYPHADFTRTTF